MSIKKILTAAAAALTIGFIAAPTAAEAAPHGGFHGGFGYHAPRHETRRFVDHRIVFNNLRGRHMRFTGNPYFHGNRYVVRSYDRYGRVVFVQINPYTGAIIGFVRL